MHPRLEAMEPRCLLATFTVLNAADAGAGSLRDAITMANANAGLDTIDFNIPGAGVHSIPLASTLPTVTDPVVIDGYSQTGASANTLAAGDNAVLQIELDGTALAAGSPALPITAGGSTVRGLIINRVGAPLIFLGTAGANTIAGNFLGTNAAGDTALGRNNAVGIFFSSSPNNTVGGTTPADRNLISGNLDGISNSGAAASGNVIEGNFIGTNAAGTGALPNTFLAIDLVSANNVIGGTAAGAGNVISGNGGGVVIGTAAATGNRVQGNILGLDVTGTHALPNATALTLSGASNNTVGGTTASARNIISGNQFFGIGFNSGASGNIVEGNFIGTDITGTIAIGNTSDGIHIDGAMSNTIGGTAAGAGNLISGNGGSGIATLALNGPTSHFLIQGNKIGTDISGTVALGNKQDGISLDDLGSETIGGTATGAGNLVSGNTLDGIFVGGGSSPTNDTIQGNLIGTAVTGTAALGNGGRGLHLTSASGNTIGGTDFGAGNTISGNLAFGIQVEAGLFPATNNLIQGNFIGTDSTGTAALGNVGVGVALLDAASNTIGGTATGAGNVISGNTSSAILIQDPTATGNLVQGNFLGTDATGTMPLPNGGGGVAISNAPANTIGGTDAGAENVISGNNSDGIFIVLSGASGNLIEGNLIGTDSSGTTALPNALDGVVIDGAANTLVGGTLPGSANVISGNTMNGVNIRTLNGPATGNVIEGNLIGTDQSGNSAVGNGLSGVLVTGGTNNAIGNPGAGNVISGNAVGLTLASLAAGNQVENNFIGTATDGATPLPNTAGGVVIDGGSGNFIGTAAASNIIAGNGGPGVTVRSTLGAAAGNQVVNNFIGLSPFAAAGPGNAGDGVLITGAATTGTLVGGAGLLLNNIIAANTGSGVRIEQGASGTQVLGNFIGLDSTGNAVQANGGDGVAIVNAPANVVGGTATGLGNLIAGNTGAGVSISGASAQGNVLLGNHIGLKQNNTAAGNGAWGVAILGAPLNLIGGTTAAARNVISSNAQDGILILGAGATGNAVQGNFIGTDPSGTTVLGNNAGITIDALNNLVGGTAAGAGNLISGNAHNGVTIVNNNTAATGNVIEGNLIGTGIGGTGAMGNASYGVSINASNNQVGGTAAGAANVIASNQLGGVIVTAGTGNAILSNSIHDNVGLGIDLFSPTDPASHVTPNDPGDADTGANNLQNYPVLSSSTTGGGTTVIGGTLNSTPNTTFTIQFFSSLLPDPSGFGEGAQLLGSTSVQTDGAGNASISFTSPTVVPVGQSVSSTATDPAGNTSEFSGAVTTMQASADVSVQITDSPDPVLIGSNVTYTVTVSNSGPAAASNVNLTDTLPAGVTFVSAVASQGTAIQANGQVTAALGSLAKGASATVTIVVTPQVTGTITDTASVSATESDPTSNDNTASESTTVLPATDVSVTVTDSPDPVLVGSNLTYTVVVTNAGPSPATSVTLTDTLPAGVTFVSATPTQGTASQLNGVVSAVLGTLAKGASATVTIVVTPTAPGTITDSASVSAAEADTNPANNTAAQDTTVNAAADLAVTLADSPDPLRLGGNLTYTLTVVNNGPSPATNVVATDTLPAGVTFVSAMSTVGTASQASGIVTAQIGTLANGASATVTIVVTPTMAGTLNTSATVAATEDDPNPANNTATQATTVTPVADVALTLTGSTSPVLLGSNVTYTAVVTNNGPSPATSVSFSDTLPAGVTFVSAASTQGTAVQSNGVVTVPIGTVASGASVTVTIVVTPTAPGALQDSAMVTAAEFDPNSANNSAMTSTTVNPAADLAVTLADAPDPLFAGSPLTYTVTLTNNGPSPATSVVLTDNLPASVTVLSVTGTVGTTSPATGTVSLDIATLASGASATLTIVVRPNAAGTITDSASVTAAETDPNPANNTATTQTTVNAQADVAVAFTNVVSSVPLGSNVTYTLVVTNFGPSPATNVVLTALLSSGTTYVSSMATGGTVAVSGGNVTDTISSLAVGASVTVRVTARADVATTILTIANVSAVETDSNPFNNIANNTLTVLAPPPPPPPPAADLALALRASTSSAVVGQDLTYTITVSNGGPGDASGATVTADVPAGAMLVSSSASQGSSTNTSGHMVFALGSLPNQGTATVTIVVQPVIVGSLMETASVQANEQDPNPGNSMAVLTTMVNALPPVVMMPGSRVTNLARFGFHQQPTVLVLSFSEAMDPVRAQNPAAYQILGPGRDRLLGTADDVIIPITRAIYNPLNQTVTLMPAVGLNVHLVYQLTVRGTGPFALTSATGKILDGDGDGVQGGDFVANIDRGTLRGPAPVSVPAPQPARATVPVMPRVFMAPTTPRWAFLLRTKRGRRH